MLSIGSQLLVIESDPSKLDALSSVARFAGASNVVTCGSTAEAEISLASNTFALILCRDHLRPESGCDFIARMRAQNMDAPVVFVSFSPAAENVLAASDIANTEFLTMPFAIDDLTASINRLTAPAEHHP